jgi:tRNA (Thr-GGU) A37 N-methylase
MTTNNEINLRPVGVVRTNASDDDVRQRIAESESRIEIFPEFQEALDGLAGF